MRSPGVPTVGVEEELLLLDPETGGVRPVAPSVIADCADAEGVVAESVRFLVETRTPVCHSLAELAESIRAHRLAVADAARARDAVSVATGVPPYGLPAEPPLTDHPRYRALARQFPRAMQAAGVGGCHVHVGVPTREAGVLALRRLRPWLPVLVAVAANSPVAEGLDSGWASRRFTLVTRWPTAVPPPAVSTVGEYDHSVSAAIARGAALDARNVYYLARLSPRHPTIEVRVADVSLTAEDACGYAGLTRALVARALDTCAGAEGPDVPDRVLLSSCRTAARHGLGSDRSRQLVDDLHAHVAEQLAAAGDDAVVAAYLDRHRAEGSGADRQRRLFRAVDSPGAFVGALAAATRGQAQPVAWSAAAPDPRPSASSQKAS